MTTLSMMKALSCK